MTRAILLALLTVLAVTAAVGCTADSTTTTTATAEAASSPDQQRADPARSAGGPCELVDDEVVQRVTDADITTSDVADVQGITVCVYKAGDGERVQVASLPAADWAEALPELMRFVQDSALLSDPTNQAKFDQAEELLAEGGAGAGQAACDMFSLMVEIQGLEPGSEQVVNFVPDSIDPRAVAGQRCSDGVFSSVTLQAPGIVDDQRTFERIDRALAEVHAAGGGS